MGQINKNTHTTILLCSAALLLSTIAGVLTARWVTLPLLRLKEAAKDIAARKCVLLLSVGLMKSAN
jgi:HAMP domain-containing protein